jgi:hypothetical protein
VLEEEGKKRAYGKGAGRQKMGGEGGAGRGCRKKRAPEEVAGRRGTGRRGKKRGQEEGTGRGNRTKEEEEEEKGSERGCRKKGGIGGRREYRMWG